MTKQTKPFENIGQVFEFKPETGLEPEPINTVLKEHQVASDWGKQNLVKDLHTWAERFDFEFGLKCSTPAIMLGRLNRTTDGHFQPGRNGFGLLDEIAINVSNFNLDEEYWEVLGTLLHELLHAEHEHSGRPDQHNYHNKQYKDRAYSLGLIVDSQGHQQYAPKRSPFFDVLEKYGVQAPAVPEPIVKAAMPGKSKLKLWTCECQPNPVRVRVAIRDFQGMCLKCNGRFRKRDIS